MSTRFVGFVAKGVVEVEAGDWETALEIADERLANYTAGIEVDVELYEGTAP